MSKLAAFLRRGAPAALAALLLLGAVPAAAEESGAKVYAPELSFRSYTYSRWGDPIACPDPYTVEKVVTGVDLGVGDFKKPNDMFASADGYLYIAASGDTAADNRVVKLDKNLQVVGSFSGYIDADGQTVAFKEPLGVFITAENDIYVADGTSKPVSYTHLHRHGGVLRRQQQGRIQHPLEGGAELRLRRHENHLRRHMGQGFDPRQGRGYRRAHCQNR